MVTRPAPCTSVFVFSFPSGFPWYDTKLLDPKRQATLAEAGFNVVRLGAMWAGVQPETGGNTVNQTYIDILKVCT